MEKSSKLIKTPYDELTYAIIGCAMASHTQLGPGLRENSYQKDLEGRFGEKGLAFEAQKLYEVLGGPNRDALIGYYIPDFIVDGQIVVEIKALPDLGPDHIAQVIGYLAVTCLPLGLLINFGIRRLQYAVSCPLPTFKNTWPTTNGSSCPTGSKILPNQANHDDPIHPLRSVPTSVDSLLSF